MKSDIRIICSKFEVSESMKCTLSQDNLEKIVKNNLARIMADFIFNNLHELPIEYTIDSDHGCQVDIHKIELTLINIDELIRLRDIEGRYNHIHKKPTGCYNL